MSANMEKWRHIDGSDALVDKPYMRIEFQRGDPRTAGANGCSLEDVIEVLIQKLLDFQGRDLACRENAVALWHLAEAQEALVARANAREKQGVRGSKEPHVSVDLEPRPAPVETLVL
ncbi:MAG: hypothetical protein JST30_10905 [Armatimonadetes bacterium]|nr:hypothetical protein [Armatimonadota bacterium]